MMRRAIGARNTSGPCCGEFLRRASHLAVTRAAAPAGARRASAIA